MPPPDRASSSPYAKRLEPHGIQVLATDAVADEYLEIAARIYDHMTARTEPYDLRDLHRQSGFRILLLTEEERFGDLPDYPNEDEEIEEAIAFVRSADTNSDDVLTLEELLGTNQFGNPTAMFEQELLGFLADVDRDGDGALELDDLPTSERSEFEPEFRELDADQNGFVTRAELLELVARELEGAQFEIQGSEATMTGVIGPSTPGRVLELVLRYPDAETIVMLDVPGSMDDVSNLRAAMMVREHGLATHVPGDGTVASGGTDFFLAGALRTAGPGARFGVHSWGGFGEQGADVPRDDPEHEKYLEFYRSVGIDEEFYWYTLEAASAEDIHWMTTEELELYGMLTTDAR